MTLGIDDLVPGLHVVEPAGWVCAHGNGPEETAFAAALACPDCLLELGRRARKRASGEIVLAFLVRYAHEEAQFTSDIGRRVFGRDGRAVARILRRLTEAGLAFSVFGSGDLWRATGRGREVDAVLDRITVARGGTFEGRHAAGISTTETLALR